MPRLRLRHSTGASLRLSTARPAPLIFPRSFEGTVLRGEEADRRASLVAGPFNATPLAYVTPRDENSLETLIRWAWENEIALIPRGSGTGMPGGNLGAHVVVELAEAFDEVRVLDSGGERISAGAGVVAEAADREAAGLGRFLPFLPSSARWCRVGGMIATNAAGARSFRYGSASAWIDALEGYFAWGQRFRVTGDGSDPPPSPQLLESLESRIRGTDGSIPGWPSVRKNSSGYALDRFLSTGSLAQLLVGSEGTLAIITRAELRTAPLPAQRGLVTVQVRSAEDLTALALESAAPGVTACEFFGRRFLELAGLAGGLSHDVRDVYALALIEVSGSEAQVGDGLAAFDRSGTSGWQITTTRDREAMARLWAIRHAASPTIAREAESGRVSTQFIEDSVVPPAALGAYLEGLDRILGEVGFDAVVFGHAGDANVHVNPLLDPREADSVDRARRALYEVARLVRSLGGTLSGEHGDGRIRAPLLPVVWQEPLVEAFREVKRTFDPRGILNPGVIVPLPGQDPFDGFAPRPRAYPGEEGRLGETDLGSLP